MNLDQINNRLKAESVRCRIYRFGHKLYLQATLPPKPGATKNTPHQQWICLGVQANTHGLKLAEAQARLVSAQLSLKKFDWADWGSPSESYQKPSKVADLITAFENSYFQSRHRNSKSETTWKGDYLRVYKKLPQGVPLTPQLLTEAVLATVPDSRSRRRAALAANALAKFAGLEANFATGNYSPSCVNPRDIPQDELIVEVRAAIPPEWQWTFGILAAYGLRPHEIFHLSFEAWPIVFVLEGKTGFRHVYPIYPEWADAWNLQKCQVPKCSGKTNTELGQRVSVAFHRLKIPFHAYDLRHRWAIRSMEWGLDLSLAAAQMGHSTQVHSSIYHHWISMDVHERAFQRLMQSPNRPIAPM